MQWVEVYMSCIVLSYMTELSRQWGNEGKIGKIIHVEANLYINEEEGVPHNIYLLKVYEGKLRGGPFI